MFLTHVRNLVTLESDGTFDPFSTFSTFQSAESRESRPGRKPDVLKVGTKPGDPSSLRTVVDLRERNKNTWKLASPLPNMDGILRCAARAKFRSLIDGQDAYEQIRIIPEHVPRSTVATPDGNMVSYVIQQGDCNAPATYQSLMNYLFSAYLGKFCWSTSPRAIPLSPLFTFVYLIILHTSNHRLR